MRLCTAKTVKARTKLQEIHWISLLYDVWNLEGLFFNHRIGLKFTSVVDVLMLPSDFIMNGVLTIRLPRLVYKVLSGFIVLKLKHFN